ncbi:hypothetical protein, partial [Micromonospora sp. NPDC006431]|uniref:hypothetical protein n=1 Tax=Micromonospora sp. NPDC006431 TaxID=3364235 RepID=UPI0036840525
GVLGSVTMILFLSPVEPSSPGKAVSSQPDRQGLPYGEHAYGGEQAAGRHGGQQDLVASVVDGCSAAPRNCINGRDPDTTSASLSTTFT